MKIDELIKYAEANTGDYIFINEHIDKCMRIALATLKITKNGYAIVSKQYGDMIAKTMEDELIHIDESYKDYTGKTELDTLLESLK